MSNDESFWAHSTALVEPGARLGAGTKVWHFSHICADQVEIGKDCSFGQNTYVGPRVRIGRGVRVQNNVSIYDCVELEDYVFCGPSAVFTNVINPRAHIPRKAEYLTTRVRQGASLGANCTIVCGVEIGRFAFVAAGSVVTKSVPAFALVQGVPARFKKWICHCGVVLEGEGQVSCSTCHSRYLISKSTCEALQLERCFVDR